MSRNSTAGRWVDYWAPVREVIYFKRAVYARALQELGELAFTEGPPPRPEWWSEAMLRANEPNSRRPGHDVQPSVSPPVDTTTDSADPVVTAGVIGRHDS